MAPLSLAVPLLRDSARRHYISVSNGRTISSAESPVATGSPAPPLSLDLSLSVSLSVSLSNEELKLSSRIGASLQSVAFAEFARECLYSHYHIRTRPRVYTRKSYVSKRDTSGDRSLSERRGALPRSSSQS